MSEFFAEISVGYIPLLFLLGMTTFTLSTISGGGGAMMQIPILNFLIGTSSTAPVINLGALVSRPSRIIIFWKHIVWKVLEMFRKNNGKNQVLYIRQKTDFR